MKLFNILLLWSSVLFTHVLADNTSIAYELIYFYYVYKFQWESGADKTIAVGCSAAYGTEEMCYFDEFAKYLIANGWPYSPTTDDHTKTPTASQATALNKDIPHSARFSLTKLMAAFSSEKAMTIVLERVLDAANTALDVEGYEPAKADLKQAIEMTQRAQAARYDKYNWLEDQALEDTAPDAAEYIVKDGANYDWDETFDKIDDAVNDDEIEYDEGETYKAELLNFSQNIDARVEATLTSQNKDITKTQKDGILEHLHIIRSLGTTTNELNEHVVAESDDSGDSLRAPSHCSSDNIEFGDSD
ncbi:hypothetical protein BO70DRAFT_350219 [Aspergillus heteromorphus CBS 117.55]|uniref:Uncharacterized protein n=1 Tax=Aspergillus heteromorphus CBS 117.55 TaxID=1448321 RepID=A0A317WR81_9EURO|nr:uncharacterized protein BO70DRAFT_350219 [Aspergillus heteromorphus CBS 117.55]PWY88959.1 hypothetical protein BO70DRAFT_350219 [Aspergillus heteromorphus CBS 117.55]